jgi:E3 ubiquitin-protein ligase TRIP12
LRAFSSLFTRKRTSDRRELDTAVQESATTVMPPSSSSSSSKSKKSRRKDISDLDDTHPDLMDLDHDEEIESPLDEHRMIDDEFAAAAAAASATAAAEEDREEENVQPPSISTHIMRNLSSIRGIHGMMNNVHGTLKNILPNLRNCQDPTMQHIALQELAELLAISTEETLAGYLSPEPYVVELIKILKGGEDYSPFGDNPDIMLLASRCLANLMEALPQSTGTVVYSGAVPVLCSKLLEIQYIDLAEQALSVLTRICIN